MSIEELKQRAESAQIAYLEAKWNTTEAQRRAMAEWMAYLSATCPFQVGDIIKRKDAIVFVYRRVTRVRVEEVEGCDRLPEWRVALDTERVSMDAKRAYAMDRPVTLYHINLWEKVNID